MTTDNDLSAASGWRKASYSSTNGNCVEVAQTPAGSVAVRDTTDQRGPTLAVQAGVWRAFMAGIREGHTVL